MKVMSADVVHKFDAGGVILNVHGAEEARAAYKKIHANVEKAVPGAKIEGILVEQMAPKGVEVILGASRDPRFGPLMMFGLGGTLVEVLKDVSFRLAPMWQISAERMVRQIRSFKVLDGFRGTPPSDIDAIVNTLLRLSAMVCNHPEISELDINPLIVHAQGQGLFGGRQPHQCCERHGVTLKSPCRAPRLSGYSRLWQAAHLAAIPPTYKRKRGVSVPAHAIVVLVAGMGAAWLAAGSTGLLGHPLQHALTWFALVVAIVAACPSLRRSFGTWVILAAGVILGLIFTTSNLSAVNVLAVAVVLAAVAQVSRGLTGRIALIAALAATVLGCFRFACDFDSRGLARCRWFGWILGRLAGWLTGHRLEAGATFGGIDFLVLMAAIYAAWMICTAPPHRPRALWVVAAIVVGHFAYLMALAYSEELLAVLPGVVVPL